MPQGSVAGPTSMMENGMEVMWLNIFSAKLGCALVRPNLSVFEEAQRLETPSATMGTGLAFSSRGECHFSANNGTKPEDA